MSRRSFGIVSLLAPCLLMNCMSQPDENGTPDLRMSTGDLATLAFNGCNDGDFMDQSATAASRTVTFGNPGLSYSPKCLLIAAGQMVTWNGSFGSHPLRAGTVASQTDGSPSNPITLTMTGTTVAFTFPTAGTYPYICTVHGGAGMVGVVRVK